MLSCVSENSIVAQTVQILDCSTPANAYAKMPRIMRQVFGDETVRQQYFGSGTLDQMPDDDVEMPPLNGRLIHAIQREWQIHSRLRLKKFFF